MPYANALDTVTRRVIRATQEDLRRWMHVRQLETDLLGALYLRVREVLEREHLTSDRDVIEDVVLTIYLTAAAWQSRSDPPLALLSSLHTVIAKTFSEQPLMAAPADGARSNP